MAKPGDEAPQRLSFQAAVDEVVKWLKVAWFAAIPVFLVGLNIFCFSFADPQVVAAVVSNMNVAGTLFTVAFDALVNFGILLPPVCCVLWTYIRPRSVVMRTKRGFRWRFQPHLIGRGLIIWLALTPFSRWANAVGGMGFLLTAVATVWVSDKFVLMEAKERLKIDGGDDWKYPPDSVLRYIEGKARKYNEAGGGSVRTLVALSVAILTVLSAMLANPPFPLELIRVSGETRLQAGYVVDVDDTSLKMVYRNGGMRLIPIDQVKGRFICPSGSVAIGGDFRDVSTARIAVEIFLKPYVPPECNTAASQVWGG